MITKLVRIMNKHITTDEKYIFFPANIEGMKTMKIDKHVMISDIIVFIPFFLQKRIRRTKNIPARSISESVL